MKSKLHTRTEEAWSRMVIAITVILFLIMIFAWVVILILTVAKSFWFVLLVPLWPLDIWALGKLLKYAARKWGAECGTG